MIGVQELPGTIRYEYHYHKDAAGGNPHSEQSAQQGGCYTIAHYHVHSKQEGCYEVEEYHRHTDDCPGHSVWVDWDGEGYWGYIYECGDRPLNASKEVLICEKSTDTVDSYLPSCGLADGQIIGATIVYDRSAVSGQVQALMAREEEAHAAANKAQAALSAPKEENELPPPAPQWAIEEMERQQGQDTQEEKAPEETGLQRPTETGQSPETGQAPEGSEEAPSPAMPETESGTGPTEETEAAEETKPTEETEAAEEAEPTEEAELSNEGESTEGEKASNEVGPTEETEAAEETNPSAEAEVPENQETPAAPESGDEPGDAES